MFITRDMCCLLLVLFVVSTPLNAHSTAVQSNFNNPQLVGEARLKVMLWNVFDAALYSEKGVYDNNKAFALSLTYLRSLKGEKIVEKTLQEIRRLAAADIPDARLQDWQKRLSGIIPDVTSGVSITGVRTQEGHTVLYSENEKIGSIEDEEFTRLFFSIWLGEKTAEPALRTKLLGLDRTS